MQPSNYAVITGDIIGSMEIKGNYLLKLHQISHDIKTNIDDRLIMDIYRGDSFQMISSKPALGLLLLLIIKAGLRRFSNQKGGLEEQWDARLALGIGILDKYPPKHSLGEVTGDPFIKSGRALDQMKGEERLLKIVTGKSSIDEEFEAVMPLIEAIASRWTTAQSEAIYLLLLQKKITQAEMGNVLGGISQRAVGKRLNAANIDSLGKYLTRFEKIIRHNGD